METKLTKTKLRETVKKIVENSLRDLMESKKIIKEDIENTDFQIIPIKSLNQMRKYGHDSKWDLVNRKYFDYYANKGQLYILLSGSEKYCAFVRNGKIDILSDIYDIVHEPSEVLPQSVIDKLITPFGNQNNVKEGKKTKRVNESFVGYLDNTLAQDFKIIPIKSLNQMNKYGHDSKWCLTQRRFFDYYANRGQLYILKGKDGKLCAFVRNGKIEILSNERDETLNPNEILPQSIISQLESGAI